MSVPGVTYLSDGGPLDVSEVSNKRDVGSLPGTAWKLSSHKPGAGVAALRDPDLGQLWQSDGLQPHVVDILFPRRTAVTHVSVYLDVTLDDSYTPTRIGIKAGTYFADLAEVCHRDLGPSKGWVHFPLSSSDDSDGEESVPRPIWVYQLQVCIYANHLNGKDTHLRSLRLFGPPLPSEGRVETQPTSVRAGHRQAYEQLAAALSDPLPPASVSTSAGLPSLSKRTTLLHSLR